MSSHLASEEPLSGVQNISSSPSPKPTHSRLPLRSSKRLSQSSKVVRSVPARTHWKTAAAARIGAQTVVLWEPSVLPRKELRRLTKILGHDATIIKYSDGTLIALWQPTCYPNNHFGLKRLLKELPRPKEVKETDSDVIKSEYTKERGGEDYLLCQRRPYVMDNKEWDAFDQKHKCSIIFSDISKVIVAWKPVWLQQETVA